MFPSSSQPFLSSHLGERSGMAENGTGVGPRDAAVMEAILKEMGVEDFEPNVIHQMLEFTYSQLILCVCTPLNQLTLLQLYS